MTKHRIYTTSVASVYPHYVTKAEWGVRPYAPRPTSHALLQRRRHPQLEPVEIPKLEHPRTPRPVFRLTEQLAADCLDPRRRGIDIRRRCHVDLEVAPLPLDPLPAELAVVLVEDNANITRAYDGAGDLAIALERLLRNKPDGISVPSDRGLDVSAGE